MKTGILSIILLLLLAGMAGGAFSDIRSAAIIGQPMFESCGQDYIASEPNTEWYTNKRFDLYLFDYLSKPETKYDDVEVINIINNTWLVWVSQNGKTHYTPITGVSRLELIE